MALSLSSSFRSSLTLLSVLLLGACDNGGEEAAQPQGALPAAKPALSGEMDTGEAGSLMPALLLTNPDGGELNTGALQGQPVLINLWATWCGPCVVEMPMLDTIAADYEGRLRVVTVSQDLRGAEVVEPFFSERELANLPRWLDPEAKLGAALSDGAAGLPLTVLYDAQGREVWRVLGAYDWTSAEARQRIDAALAAD